MGSGKTHIKFHMELLIGSSAKICASQELVSYTLKLQSFGDSLPTSATRKRYPQAHLSA